ncbi:hypothetical protein HQ576_15545 [bacterium]|nr:hypothetical protein [bacterium]
MSTITVQQPADTPGDAAERRELVERMAHLQRRLAALDAAARASGEELRRQRASGRRP